MKYSKGRTHISTLSTYLIYQDGGLGDSEPQNKPGTEWETRTLNSIAWGFWRQDLPITNTQLSNGQRLGIEEVHVGKTFLQLLITLLTLGFWAPVLVSWRGCRPPVQSGILQ